MKEDLILMTSTAGMVCLLLTVLINEGLLWLLLAMILLFAPLIQESVLVTKYCPETNLSYFDCKFRRLFIIITQIERITRYYQQLVAYLISLPCDECWMQE